MTSSSLGVPARARLRSRLPAIALLALVLLTPGLRLGSNRLSWVRDARANAGDQQWDGLGANGLNDAVYALATFQGELIVAGFFTEAGSAPAARGAGGGRSVVSIAGHILGSKPEACATPGT